MKSLLFVSNQGGVPVIDLNCAVAADWTARTPDARARFAVWYDSEELRVREQLNNVDQVRSFESFLVCSAVDWTDHVLRLEIDYPDVNWAAVIASERSFTDSSFLLGGAGHRIESHDYVQRLLVRIVLFFESLFRDGDIDAIVCQTADSFFTHVLFKVTAKFGIRILAIKPTWITEHDNPGFCLTSDEYTHSPAMISAYRDLLLRDLSEPERIRAEKLRSRILNTDLNKLVARTARRKYIVGPLSPNLKRLPMYLWENRRQNKELNYQQFDPLAKARANLLRLWRRQRSSKLLGTRDGGRPVQYVFLPFQFQPEQTTLVGGIFFSNQVALAENVAKALPLGWTLVIKEHPKGRGSRPAWQYRHLSSFPNVNFSDAASHDLIRNAGAVVTVTSTVALEAVAMDRPAFLLGRTYFDYSEAFYKPTSWPELAALMKRVLVHGACGDLPNRRDIVQKFLLSLALGTWRGFPSVDNAPEIATAIISEASI